MEKEIERLNGLKEVEKAEELEDKVNNLQEELEGSQEEVVDLNLQLQEIEDGIVHLSKRLGYLPKEIKISSLTERSANQVTQSPSLLPKEDSLVLKMVNTEIARITLKKRRTQEEKDTLPLLQKYLDKMLRD